LRNVAGVGAAGTTVEIPAVSAPLAAAQTNAPARLNAAAVATVPVTRRRARRRQWWETSVSRVRLGHQRDDAPPASTCRLALGSRRRGPRRAAHCRLPRRCPMRADQLRTASGSGRAPGAPKQWRTLAERPSARRSAGSPRYSVSSGPIRAPDRHPRAHPRQH
jgi:hypothetical protein